MFNCKPFQLDQEVTMKQMSWGVRICVDGVDAIELLHEDGKPEIVLCDKYMDSEKPRLWYDGDYIDYNGKGGS